MKVVGCQPYAPAAFTPRINVVLIFRGWVDPRAHGTVRCHGKSRDTGIDPGTFRLVAQCLKHYATPGPLSDIYCLIIIAIRRETVATEGHLVPKHRRPLYVPFTTYNWRRCVSASNVPLCQQLPWGWLLLLPETCRNSNSTCVNQQL
jgi:hypothetical protein